MSQGNYDLNIMLSNNLTIGYVMSKAGTSVTKTDGAIKNEFEKYRGGLISGHKEYIVNKEDPLEVLSLFKPFTYLPEFHMSKFENSILPKKVITEIFKTYLKESNAKVKDIFNWLMQSMSVVNYTLIKDSVIADGDTIENKEDTNESWIKITHKEPAPAAAPASTTSSSTTSNTAAPAPAPPPTYIYPALIKIGGKYLVYYKNGKASIKDKDHYKTQEITPPSLNKSFNENEMLDIIIDNLVVRFHYLQYGDVSYDDNTEILVKEKPYFYSPYGLHSSYFYNVMLNNMRTRVMMQTKEATGSYVSRYYYSYFHLCGVYFYKAFIRKEEYKIQPIDKEYFPFIYKDFYKHKMPSDFSTTNKAIEAEINSEKEELKRQGF